MTEYTAVDPFSLQRGEKVQVKPKAGETFLCGIVSVVDTPSKYVSVLFDGATMPVALPGDDWLFESEADTAPRYPEADGLYVTADDPEGINVLYRRANGAWMNLITGDALDEEDLPENLQPLRIIPESSPSSPSSPPTSPITTITETLGGAS